MSGSAHLHAYASAAPAWKEPVTPAPIGKRHGTVSSFDSELAYLKFFALALQGSLNELRCSAANKVLLFEILDGLDLLTENLRKRFGFPSPPPNHPIAILRPTPGSQQLRLQTTLSEEAPTPAKRDQSPGQA
jgi:hypothetical protein